MIALLAAVLAGLWYFGRAPTQYVLEREAHRFQEERVRRFQELQLAIVRAESKLPLSGPVPRALQDLRRRRTALRRDVRRNTLRGWEVVLIPAGAARPKPEDFLRLGQLNVAGEDDPTELKGPVEVWCAPRGALARLLHRARVGSPSPINRE